MTTGMVIRTSLIIGKVDNMLANVPYRGIFRSGRHPVLYIGAFWPYGIAEGYANSLRDEF